MEKKVRKFNFVYITTNLINGKQYVGDHSCDNLEKDTYLGSGKLTLIPAIKKYGKENFKREILEFFDSKEEAFEAQEKYIIQYNTLEPVGYNISPKGGHGAKGCWSEESKKKNSKKLKGKKKSEEHCKHISESMTGRKLSKSQVEKIIFNNKKENRKKETLEKMSKAKKGKTWEEIYGIEGAEKRRNKNHKNHKNNDKN